MKLNHKYMAPETDGMEGSGGGGEVSTESQGFDAPDSSGGDDSGSSRLESISDAIAARLAGKSSEQSEESDDEPSSEDDDGEEKEFVAEEAEKPVTTKPAPQTWRKDMHEHWGKVAPEVQEYIELREKQMMEGINAYKEHAHYGKTLREAIAPHAELLRSQGVPEAQAVKLLLNAHAILSNGSPQERLTYLQKVAKSYSIDLAGAPQSEQQSQRDPAISQIEQELGRVKQVIARSEQREKEAITKQAEQAVEEFAKHAPYIDECAEEVAFFVEKGMSLQDAYDKAVWANPETRARLQADEARKMQESAQKKADQAKRAVSVNMNGRNTGKAPTRPAGTIREAVEASVRELRTQN